MRFDTFFYFFKYYYLYLIYILVATAYLYEFLKNCISFLFQLTKLFIIVLILVNINKPEMYYIINIKQQYFHILKCFLLKL